jgi:drug/metabolite transporter (DMT)-like permease
VNYLLAILAAALLGMGFVLQQAVAEQAPKVDFLRPRLLLDLLRHRRWLAGVATMVAGQLLSAWVIGHLILSVAEPLLTANLLFALLLAWPLSKQPLTRSEIAGALILIAGVTALSLARTIRAPEVTAGAPAHWPFAVGAVAMIAAAFAALGRRRSGDLRATLTGASAGVTFGIQDALTRRVIQVLTGHGAAALFTTWAGYTLIAVGLIGFWLMSSAFSAGPLHASLPAITAGEPVAGIALGIVVFGDELHTSPGLIAVQVAGLVALVWGVILVARGPALASTRRSAAGPRGSPDRAPGRPPDGGEHPDPVVTPGQQPRNARGQSPAASQLGDGSDGTDERGS